MSEEDILRKLDEIEDRLARIESTPERQVVMEEKTEIAKEGEFEGNQTSREGGAIVKTKRITVCDYCFGKLGEDFGVCHKDGKKLCKTCSIRFRNRTVCPTHLREVYPLSRPAYKVLTCVSNGIDDIGDICQLTHIQKGDVKDLRNILCEGGYVERCGFSRRRITDEGIEAMSGYSQLFSDSGDMKQLEEEMREFVQGEA